MCNSKGDSADLWIDLYIGVGAFFLVAFLTDLGTTMNRVKKDKDTYKFITEKFKNVIEDLPDVIESILNLLFVFPIENSTTKKRILKVLQKTLQNPQSEDTFLPVTLEFMEMLYPYIDELRYVGQELQRSLITYYTVSCFDENQSKNLDKVVKASNRFCSMFSVEGKIPGDNLPLKFIFIGKIIKELMETIENYSDNAKEKLNKGKELGKEGISEIKPIIDDIENINEKIGNFMKNNEELFVK